MQTQRFIVDVDVRSMSTFAHVSSEFKYAVFPQAQIFPTSWNWLHVGLSSALVLAARHASLPHCPSLNRGEQGRQLCFD